MQGYKRRTFFRPDIMQATFVTVPFVDMPTSGLNSQDFKPWWARKQNQAMLWNTCLPNSSCRYLRS